MKRIDKSTQNKKNALGIEQKKGHATPYRDHKTSKLTAHKFKPLTLYKPETFTRYSEVTKSQWEGFRIHFKDMFGKKQNYALSISYEKSKGMSPEEIQEKFAIAGESVRLYIESNG